MNWKKILQTVLSLAIGMIIFVLLGSHFLNFPFKFKINFVKTSFKTQPTMLQVQELKEITNLIAACYIGEVIVSYIEIEDNELIKKRDNTLNMIFNIVNNGEYDYSYLNTQSTEFLRKIGVDSDTRQEEVPKHLEGWRKKLLEKELQISGYSYGEKFLKCFDIIANRMNIFRNTYEQFKAGKYNSVSSDEIKSIKYDLGDMLNLNPQEKKNPDKNTYKITAENKEFDLICWEAIAKKLFKKELKDCFGRELQKTFLSHISALDKDAPCAYFIEWMGKPDRKLDKIRLLIDYCKIDGGIDPQNYRNNINAKYVDPIETFKNKNSLKNLLDKSVDDKIKKNGEDVVLLARGRVFAKYDLSHIECYYSPMDEDKGTLFIVSNLDIKPIVNPYLIFNKQARVNGFEVIKSDKKDTNNDDLLMTNSILSELIKEGGKKLREDAINAEIEKDAKESAQTCLLRLIQAIGAEKPGKIDNVDIIQDKKEIDRSKYKFLIRFGQKENEYWSEEVPL
ncbi:MAG TPA: hypothetical protein VK255_00880 [Patescibacteria group bacterium]|nr:hypothetical protein [Patescibacteria group bacterium]HLP49167.1 hypothetical protein [Candidatus Kapabacteria bacterium]